MSTRGRTGEASSASLFVFVGSLVAIMLIALSGCVSVAARPTVVLFGDSLALQAAPYFDHLVESSTDARVTNHVFGGSAVCDWLPTMKRVAATRPQVAVLEFSGNTFTPCMDRCAAGSSSAIAKYCTDTATAIGYFLAAGTHLFLIGTPITYAQWAANDRNWAELNHEYSILASEHSGAVTYVYAGLAVEGPRGSFTWTLPCLRTEPCTGPSVGGVKTNFVRASDGVHFCNLSKVPIGCATYSSGAFRFASAMAAPVIRAIRH